jgi:hypothetical protein
VTRAGPTRRERRRGRPAALSAKRPRERHDLDARRAAASKRLRRVVHRRPGRVDVVDEHDATPRLSVGREEAAHVRSAPRELERRLPAGRACSTEKRPARKRPVRGQLLGERRCRMTRSFELTHEVRRDIGDDVRRRARDAFGNKPGGQGRKAAEAALLPRVHECDGGAFVGNGRPRACEREAPPRAFATSIDRPHRRCATSRTARRCQRPERTEAGRAETRGRAATGDAAWRKDEIQKPRWRRYGDDGHVSVTAPQQKCDN